MLATETKTCKPFVVCDAIAMNDVFDYVANVCWVMEKDDLQYLEMPMTLSCTVIAPACISGVDDIDIHMECNDISWRDDNVAGEY